MGATAKTFQQIQEHKRGIGDWEPRTETIHTEEQYQTLKRKMHMYRRIVRTLNQRMTVKKTHVLEHTTKYHGTVTIALDNCGAIYIIDGKGKTIKMESGLLFLYDSILDVLTSDALDTSIPGMARRRTEAFGLLEARNKT